MTKPHPCAPEAIAATIVAAAACSAPPRHATIVGDTATPTTVSTSEPTATIASTVPASSLPDLTSLPLADFDAEPDVDVEQFVSPGMGGIRFSSTSVDHTTAIIHDSVLIFTEPPNPVINGPTVDGHDRPGHPIGRGVPGVHRRGLPRNRPRRRERHGRTDR